MTSLKSHMVIGALRLTLEGLGLYPLVGHSGDRDAGTLLLRVDGAAGVTLWRPERDVTGVLRWAVMAERLDPLQASDRIAKERDWDSDLWVVEVDDPRGVLTVDALPPL